MNESQQRLKRFITIAYKTQSNFAEKSGIDRSIISQFLNDKREIQAKTKQKLYQAGLSIDWFETGAGSMFADNEVGEQLAKQNAVNVAINKIEGKSVDKDQAKEALSNYTFYDPDDYPYRTTGESKVIKILKPIDDKIGVKFFHNRAGAGSQPDMNSGFEMVNVNDIMYNNANQTLICQVRGDSMEHDGIMNNDYVTIDTGLAPKNNDLVVANISGSIIVRRFQEIGREIWLFSSKREIEPIVMDNDDYKVIGTVISVTRKLR